MLTSYLLQTLYKGANLIPVITPTQRCQPCTCYILYTEVIHSTSAIQRCQPHTCYILCTKVPTSSLLHLLYKGANTQTCYICCTKVPTSYLLHSLYKGANIIPATSSVQRGRPHTFCRSFSNILYVLQYYGVKLHKVTK